MKRFWVSWVGLDEDFRPMTFPPPAAILGYWNSGYTVDDQPIPVVLVEAKDEQLAKEILGSDACWPETHQLREWRFFTEKPADFEPSDRFPISEWSKLYKESK